ncbi:MAG: hypothetical protein VYD19_01455 [Myxococcota bacterium]|nr:hypothetical protein [Myxococcota bacterium]
MRLLPFIRLSFTLALFAPLALNLACISEQNADLDERGSRADSAPPVAEADAGSSDPDDPTSPPEGDAGIETDGDVPVDPVDPVEPDPPPPAPELSACDRFCERMEGCFYPSCPQLGPISQSEQFCRGWCGGAGEEWLDQSAELSCEDFNTRIFAFSPELRALCTTEPGEMPCDQICEFGEVCGIDAGECQGLCGALDFGAQLCFSGAAELGDCQRYYACFEQVGRDPGQRGDVGQICEDLCNREAICVFNGCAAGTLDENFVAECTEACVAGEPDEEALVARYDQSCEEIVAAVREADPVVDMRCESSPELACENLCAERVADCGMIDADACIADCEGWDRANFVCITRAESCEEVNVCLVDEETQALCRRSCDHLQSCLEEACPPRILPPQLTDGCTADCFAEGRSEEEIEEWEALSCRDVREFIYRGNRELRPICEGNQDFRATPEECAAFCDSELGECIIGGRQLCLAACASLSRPQYVCALENRDDCEAIDVCLSDE